MVCRSLNGAVSGAFPLAAAYLVFMVHTTQRGGVPSQEEVMSTRITPVASLIDTTSNAWIFKLMPKEASQ